MQQVILYSVSRQESEGSRGMKLVVVSGLSGSGKSIVLNALEDLDYYCIDNLPLSLLPAFATQMSLSPQNDYQSAAVGIDARNLAEGFDSFPTVLAEIRASGIATEILFLKADEATLIKRFSETRRRHPLTRSGASLAEAIQAESRLLAPMVASADWSIDTSRCNIHQLRDQIRERMVETAPGLALTITSFGFKHGVPVDADFVFDVRCLPNPHWVPELRAFTGEDEPVKAFLSQEPDVEKMFSWLEQFLTDWVPCFEADNRTYLTVAIGCTGGQHRSVYLAKRLADHFSLQYSTVLLRHRELL